MKTYFVLYRRICWFIIIVFDLFLYMKYLMKKAITLSVSLILLLSLTACSLITRPANEDPVDPAYYGEGTWIILQEKVTETIIKKVLIETWSLASGEKLQINNTSSGSTTNAPKPTSLTGVK